METNTPMINLSKNSVTYIDHMGNDARAAHAARVSFNKANVEAIELTARDEKLISFLATHRHTSPFEHSAFSVAISCALPIRSQIMRHRTFSYNEVSRRYTSEKIEFFDVDSFKKQAHENLQCSTQEDIDNPQYATQIVHEAYDFAYEQYVRLLELGVSREKARFVLPQGIMTSFWMTGNLLNWMKFLSLRLDPHAQEECREIAIACRDLLQQHFPKTIEVFEAEGWFSK